MNMPQLEKIVKSDFKSLQPSQAIGRIMLVTGRSYSRSCKGLEIMQSQGLFKDFITPAEDDPFMRMVQKNPVIAEMMDALDCVPPGKVIKLSPDSEKKQPSQEKTMPKGEKSGIESGFYPVPTDPETVIRALNLPDF